MILGEDGMMALKHLDTLNRAGSPPCLLPNTLRRNGTRNSNDPVKADQDSSARLHGLRSGNPLGVAITR